MPFCIAIETGASTGISGAGATALAAGCLLGQAGERAPLPGFERQR